MKLTTLVTTAIAVGMLAGTAMAGSHAEKRFVSIGTGGVTGVY